MTCYVHPDRESYWTCEACGQPVCPECKVSILGRTYCNACVEQMYVTALSRKRPSFFETHLNWVLLCGLFITGTLSFAGGILLAFMNPEVTEEALLSQMQIVGSIIFYLIMFPITAWVVRKKGRNPWNILWLLAPFGVVMVLLLSNMSRAPQNPPEDNRIP